MRKVGLVAVMVMVVASCNQSRTSPSPPRTGGSTTLSTHLTTTTVPEPEVFHLFAGEGFDLDVFRRGLIDGEDGAVDELFAVSPLYEADLTLNGDLTGFQGSFAVRYTNKESIELDEVVFRLFPNIADGSTDISSLQADGAPVEPTYELEESVLRVSVDPLSPGDSVLITMEIDVAVPIEEGGKYGTFLLDDGILSLAHALPLAAVHDDEGWNLEIAPPNGDSVYSDSAFFMVRIALEPELTLVASGSLIATEEIGDGTSARLYAGGPIRDFYMAVGDFDVIQAQSGDTSVSSYAPAGFRVRNQMVLDFAVSSLGIFGDLYGTYPFTELDIVSTRTLALGVEYPGAIAMAMGHYDPAEQLDEPTIVSTIVHEVAHQWFYSTVGNDQLDEPWLDESMAQYATWKWWGLTQGEAAAEGFEAHLDARWARVEGADIPIGLPVAAYEDAEYGAIIYGRGPLEIANLADPMGGSESLDTFLSQFASENKYGIVSSVGFQESAEAWCGCDLSAEFDAVVYPR